MKILFWTGLFPPFIGGLEQFGAQLCGTLRQRGHEVVVVSMLTGAPLPDFSYYDDIPVYRFDFSGVLTRKNPAEIASLIRRIGQLKETFRPELVHLNDFTVGLFFHQRTATAVACPTVYTIHTSPRAGFHKNSLLGRMLLASAWLPAVSRAMLDEVRACVPEMAHRTSVILNGLRSPSLVPSPLPHDLYHILCIGRMITDKGFDLAIDAVAALLPDFPALHLTIAGDGLARTQLEAQAARLGIARAVQFPGWITPEAIPALINSAALVVVPSRWQEPFGLVAVQAAQMARPVVATQVGGLPEIVLQGRTGLLTPPNDSHGLAEHIRYLLDHPAQAQAMGMAARERASQCFSLSRMADDYERLYARVQTENVV